MFNNELKLTIKLHIFEGSCSQVVILCRFIATGDTSIQAIMPLKIRSMH